MYKLLFVFGLVVFVSYPVSLTSSAVLPSSTAWINENAGDLSMSAASLTLSGTSIACGTPTLESCLVPVCHTFDLILLDTNPELSFADFLAVLGLERGRLVEFVAIDEQYRI